MCPCIIWRSVVTLIKGGSLPVCLGRLSVSLDGATLNSAGANGVWHSTPPPPPPAPIHPSLVHLANQASEMVSRPFWHLDLGVGGFCSQTEAAATKDKRSLVGYWTSDRFRCHRKGGVSQANACGRIWPRFSIVSTLHKTPCKANKLFNVALFWASFLLLLLSGLAFLPFPWFVLISMSKHVSPTEWWCAILSLSLDNWFSLSLVSTPWPIGRSSPGKELSEHA